ncbi:MAG: aldo/keto reductase [Lachnospiraceae bacterium]|uniref:Aldo/keto reductase n=1 Tax=Candidatus Weimeria bifida TaxID=2599074 RepID=A0A6N7IXG8_9FIRM|nr:aldo/keto reductase [Candidatus Weimeria bifida]RRF97178.1 MAG: aldo/keto reductase [Lachnospiraceae bacterium]
MQTIPSRKLSNGVEIPAIGFGCYKLADARITELMKNAVQAGYRHFDTASFYETEEGIGEAIRKIGIDRKELFLTSKIWKTEMADTEASFYASLKRLQTDYLDLYLIHWPRPDLSDPDWQEKDLETWHVMEKLYKKGDVRAIGVSNFLPQHLIPLMKNCEIAPMTDQLEIHPGYGQECAVAFAKEHGIQMEAWSPLSRGRATSHPLLQELADKYNRSVYQICLRYSVQQGIIPLPKSSSPDRMRLNLDVFDFEISEEDMYRLRTMPQAGWSGEHPDFETVTV